MTGVRFYWGNRAKPWRARIFFGKHDYECLGYYATEAEAAEAYRQAAEKEGRTVRAARPRL